jgi:putative hemolysin
VEFLELMGVDADPQKVNVTSYVTLGGFILDKLGKIPENGDNLKWRGMKLEVMEMDQHRIAKVHVSKIKKSEED